MVNDVLERVKQEAATTYMAALLQHLPHNYQLPLPVSLFIILTQPYG